MLAPEFFLFLFVLASLQKCHESGQKLKLDNMNEWYIVNLPDLFKYLPNLFNTFNCLDAFLQMFEIWDLNLSSKSIVTPSNFISC